MSHGSSSDTFQRRSQWPLPSDWIERRHTAHIPANANAISTDTFPFSTEVTWMFVMKEQNILSRPTLSTAFRGVSLGSTNPHRQTRRQGCTEHTQRAPTCKSRSLMLQKTDDFTLCYHLQWCSNSLLIDSEWTTLTCQHRFPCRFHQNLDTTRNAESKQFPHWRH